MTSWCVRQFSSTHLRSTWITFQFLRPFSNPNSHSRLFFDPPLILISFPHFHLSISFYLFKNLFPISLSSSSLKNSFSCYPSPDLFLEPTTHPSPPIFISHSHLTFRTICGLIWIFKCHVWLGVFFYSLIIF